MNGESNLVAAEPLSRVEVLTPLSDTTNPGSEITPVKQSSRPKYVAIAESILGDIQAGKFSVGGRLPSDRELSRLYGVAYLTMRQSVSLLAKKGLVIRQRQRGTFVAKTATHQASIGVLFNHSLTQEIAHFYRALTKAISEELRRHNLTVRVYHGMDEGDDWQQSQTFRHLLTDLHHYPFQGLMGISLPQDWNPPSVIRALPLVRLGDVCVDYEHFGFESMACLNRLGKKKIVYLRTCPQTPAWSLDLAGIDRAVRQFGMARPRIEQFEIGDRGFAVEVELQAYQKTLRLVEEWRRKGQWADAVMISDDIGARGAALALIKEGVRVPADVSFLTQTSEGIDLHYGIPVVRWEIRPREIARHLVEVLQQRISDPKVELSPRVIPGRIVS